MTSATRNWFAANIDIMVADHNFKHLEQVPVVVAMRTAEQYASKEGMTFRTPSLHPRNPKNQPSEFERRALQAFEKDPSQLEFVERVSVDGREIMRYAQPVRIGQDCLQCHGNPAGEKDPFGYAKEGMQAAEMRAAFVLEAPTSTLLQQSRSNMIATFLISLLTVLTAIAVVYVVLRQLVIQPVKECAEFAAIIANKNLTVPDLEIRAGDEVGDAMRAMNTMKNNLHEVVLSIAETAGHVASASEELSATSQQISTNSEETSAQAGNVSQSAQQVSENLHSVSTGGGGDDLHHSVNRFQCARGGDRRFQRRGERASGKHDRRQAGRLQRRDRRTSSRSSPRSRSKPTCWRSTPRSKRRAPARPARALPSSPTKSRNWPSRPPRPPRTSAARSRPFRPTPKARSRPSARSAGVINQINDISNTIATAVEEQTATTNEMTRNVADAAKGSGEITRNIEGVAEAARGTSSALWNRRRPPALAEMAAQLHRLMEQFELEGNARPQLASPTLMNPLRAWPPTSDCKTQRPQRGEAKCQGSRKSAYFW